MFVIDVIIDVDNFIMIVVVDFVVLVEWVWSVYSDLC